MQLETCKCYILYPLITRKEFECGVYSNIFELYSNCGFDCVRTVGCISKEDSDLIEGGFERGFGISKGGFERIWNVEFLTPDSEFLREVLEFLWTPVKAPWPHRGRCFFTTSCCFAIAATLKLRYTVCTVQRSAYLVSSSLRFFPIIFNVSSS